MSERDLSRIHISSNAPKAARQRSLLIVDDDPRICRALSRRLNGIFKALYTASTVEEANRRLESEKITHLICDQNLGDRVPRGTTLIEKWRCEHSSIERAVLFTGTRVDDVVRPSGLDAAIIPKTTDFFDLMRALGLVNADCRADSK